MISLLCGLPLGYFVSTGAVIAVNGTINGVLVSLEEGFLRVDRARDGRGDAGARKPCIRPECKTDKARAIRHVGVGPRWVLIL
jgi:hypothetical protein